MPYMFATGIGEINNLIAYLDIRELYIQYLACKAQLKKEHEKLEERRATCTNLTKLVDELEAKQKNVRVALSIINRNLSYIFFSNDRFKIDYRNNNYVLLSNGKPVQPSKISQGERNIIGLCYFFASILENQEETTAYTKEYLLLIDDPVSSFDMENKTGIMSFLRYQLGKFLLGNEYTKSIIMTHDLLTYYDSEKMFGELIEASKVKYGGDKPVYKRYELKNKILIPFPHNGRQEYTELMKIVYRFALGDNPIHCYHHVLFFSVHSCSSPLSNLPLLSQIRFKYTSTNQYFLPNLIYCSGFMCHTNYGLDSESVIFTCHIVGHVVMAHKFQIFIVNLI